MKKVEKEVLKNQLFGEQENPRETPLNPCHPRSVTIKYPEP
jgi:hypothetical protein